MDIGSTLFGEKLEVRKTEKGHSFYANFMVRGKRIHKLLGKTENQMNLTKARTAVNQLIAEQSASPYKSNAFYEKTFKQAADKYLELQTASGGKNIRQKRQQIRDHLTPFFGNFWVHELSTGLTEKYAHKRRSVGTANATINRELAVFRHIGKTLFDHRLLASPFPAPKTQKEGGKKKKLSPIWSLNNFLKPQGTTSAHISP